MAQEGELCDRFHLFDWYIHWAYYYDSAWHSYAQTLLHCRFSGHDNWIDFGTATGMQTKLVWKAQHLELASLTLYTDGAYELQLRCNQRQNFCFLLMKKISFLASARVLSQFHQTETRQHELRKLLLRSDCPAACYLADNSHCGNCERGMRKHCLSLDMHIRELGGAGIFCDI